MTDTDVTLAELRKNAGLSHQQVADRMGVSKPRVVQIEADYPNLKYTVVLRYLDAVGASVRVTTPGTQSLDVERIVAAPERSTTRQRRARHRTHPNSPTESEPRDVEVLVGP